MNSKYLIPECGEYLVVEAQSESRNSAPIDVMASLRKFTEEWGKVPFFIDHWSCSLSGDSCSLTKVAKIGCIIPDLRHLAYAASELGKCKRHKIMEAREQTDEPLVYMVNWDITLMELPDHRFKLSERGFVCTREQAEKLKAKEEHPPKE